MKRISNFTFTFLSALVAIALVCVLVGSVSVFNNSHISDSQIPLVILMCLGILAGILICFLKIKTKYKVLLMMAVALIIRVWWVVSVPSVPVSDFLTIYNSAKGFLSGNVGPFRDYGYLARFPHLVPMSVYMMLMIKVFGIHHILAMKCVSVGLSVLTVYLVYRLSGYYVKNEKARLVAMLIAVVYPSFISYCSTFCTENIGIPFYLLSLIVFNKAIGSDKKKLLVFAGCGALLYLGNMFRGVAIVFLIAYIIYMLIFVKPNKITGIVAIIAGYLAVSIVVSSLLLATGVINQPLWESKEPSVATLMLKGSNFEHNGTWNPDDAHFVDEHLRDENLSQLCFDKIKERLSEKSPLEIAGFYGGKFISQWTVGDCSGTYWATIETDVPYDYPLPKIFQLIYVAVVFLSLFVFISGNKNYPLAQLLLLLCGFGAAFIMLETQGRYSYIVSWIFIILAACGVDNLNFENKYIAKIRDLYIKYKEQANYLIFGVVTTVVNIISYYVLYNKLNISNVPSTVIAWLLSVITAYLTNKVWVFESKSLKPAVLVREISSFFTCRLLTGVFDVAIMWVGVDLLFLNSTIIKILSNVIVVILNYVLSKVFIFKKDSDKNTEE